MSDTVLRPFVDDEKPRPGAARLKLPQHRRLVATGLLTTAMLLSVFVLLPAAGAATGPKLKISPATIYYPCSEGNVTFKVVRFTFDHEVNVHLGSPSGKHVATMRTNSSGTGDVVVDFTDTAPGSYTYYAVSHGKGPTASAVLTVGECP
jgi:hypothetical protein